MQIKYQKRKDKTLVKIAFTNVSHSTFGNYVYYIYLEFKNDKLSLSKIEEIPFSELKLHKF